MGDKINHESFRTDIDTKLGNTSFPRYHDLSPWVRDGLYLMEHCCSERAPNDGYGLKMMSSPRSNAQFCNLRHLFAHSLRDVLCSDI